MNIKRTRPAAKRHALNRERIKAQQKIYRRQNKDKISAWQKEYNERNKDKIRASKSEYFELHKDKILAWKRYRYAHDELYRLSCRRRSATQRAWKELGVSKPTSTSELLGCSFQQAFDFFESQFALPENAGMSWDNRDQWHIDHIVPLSSAKTKAELVTLCNLSNLQLLWASENLEKGSKLDWVRRPPHSGRTTLTSDYKVE